MEKIEIGSKWFCIYFVYILLIWGFEAADCLCYAVGIPQTSLISRILIIVLYMFIFWKGRAYFTIKKQDFHFKILIGLFVIIVIGLLKSVYPDTATDTYNYHLIAQNPGFVNYFTEHFGKGNFQVWGFRLPDRLFTIFRRLLGYRYGTLLNTWILMLSYFQLNELLKTYSDSFTEKKSVILKVFGSTELWALIIMLIHYNLLDIATYYVDLLAFPIGFEILRKLFDSLVHEQSIGDIYYMALLNGMWVAFKLTNIVYVIPCLILYIVLIRGQLTPVRVLLSGVFSVVPCSIYLIVNFISTGNPIFPYFNRIFQSPYFTTGNFKDVRWGGQNFFEKIVWIVYMAFRPEYRQSEIYDKYTFIFKLGIIATVFLCIRSVICILKKGRKIGISELFVFLLISSSLLWGFTTGYSRYYMFGMILLGMSAYFMLNYLKFWKILKPVILVITINAILQTGFCIKDFFQGEEWAWRKWTLDSFFEQCTQVLKDQNFSETKVKDIDMFFMTGLTGIAEMLDPQIYTYSAIYEGYLEDKNIARDALRENEELFLGNVYDVIGRTLNTIEEYVDCLNALGMQIEEFHLLETVIGKQELVKIAKRGKNLNVVYLGENVEIKCPDELDHGEILFMCGRTYDWEGSPGYKIVVKKQKGSYIETIYEGCVDYKEIISYQIELGNVDRETRIQIEFYDMQGNPIDFQNEINKVFVLNPCLRQGTVN